MIYEGQFDATKQRFTPRDINDFWLGLGVVTGLVAFGIIYF